MNSTTKVLILAGGLGTRLRTKVENTPKSMAYVAGMPFLEWQLLFLRSQGFIEIVLCVGYLADQVIDYFGDGSSLEMHIQYSVETEPLGTAGAIKNAEKYIKDRFLLLNGDTFLGVDYEDLLEFHDAKEALLTLSLVEVSDVSHYGKVGVDVAHKVRSFNEKLVDSKERGYINGGVYAMNPNVLEHIPANQLTSLEKTAIPDIINTGQVYGFITDGYFIDIGTPESYEQAQQFFGRFRI